ncbi:MFS transporter [Maricaulis sp. CAU 1757]
MTEITSPRLPGSVQALIAAISCAAVCGIVFGLSMPLISLRLEMMTGSGLTVGLNGAAAAFSTLVMAPLVPRLLNRVPARLLLTSCLAITAALFCLFPLFPDVTAWFILRFASGCAITVVFVVSETWINQVVTPQRRALMLGVYGTALSGGFGLGGLLFAAMGAENDAAFYLAGLIFLTGTLPILFLRARQAVAPDRASSGFGAMLRAARSAPAAILAGLAFGALETLIFSLMPVYGDRIGLGQGMIGGLIVAVAAGALVFQIPLGWVADRTDRRATLLWIAVVATITPALTALAGSNALLLLPILFVQAGVASGLYTVGLSLLGERFTGGGIAAANAAFIFVYGLGSFLAPPVAGDAMDRLGPWGLLLVLSEIAGAYVMIVAARQFTAARPS